MKKEDSLNDLKDKLDAMFDLSKKLKELGIIINIGATNKGIKIELEKWKGKI